MDGSGGRIMLTQDARLTRAMQRLLDEDPGRDGAGVCKGIRAGIMRGLKATFSAIVYGVDVTMDVVRDADEKTPAWMQVRMRLGSEDGPVVQADSDGVSGGDRLAWSIRVEDGLEEPGRFHLDRTTTGLFADAMARELLVESVRARPFRHTLGGQSAELTRTLNETVAGEWADRGRMDRIAALIRRDLADALDNGELSPEERRTAGSDWARMDVETAIGADRVIWRVTYDNAPVATLAFIPDQYWDDRERPVAAAPGNGPDRITVTLPDGSLAAVVGIGSGEDRSKVIPVLVAALARAGLKRRWRKDPGGPCGTKDGTGRKADGQGKDGSDGHE